MSNPLPDLPPDAYHDVPWVRVLPWLAHHPAGTLRELADLSPSPDWWLTESPAVTTMAIDHYELCQALARTFIVNHSDTPLSQGMPTIPAQLPLASLPAGTRARTTFQRLDARTMGDLADTTVKQLFDTRGTGAGTVEEAMTALIAMAITLPPEFLATTSGTDRANSSATAVDSHPPAHAQLIEDLVLLARWRHIRNTSNEPLFDITVENGSPEEVQDAAQRLNSLTATDIQADADRADPIGEIRAVIGRLDERQRAVLRDRLLAIHPRTLAEVGADHGVSRERIRQIEDQLKSLLERTFHYGTSVGNLLASIRTEIQPIASLSRLAYLHPELTTDLPDLGFPLWHVLDRLDDYFEVTDGWAAAPHTQAAKEHTRSWLEDIANDHGVANLSSLAASGPMSLPELRAWLDWCGYPIHDVHVLTRTRSIGDHAAGLLSIAGEPLTTDEILERLGKDRNISSLSNALGADERFTRTDRSTWALAEWQLRVHSTIRDRVSRTIDEAGGSIELSELLDVVTRETGAALTSVRTYAASAEYETINGVIQRRSNPATTRKGPADTRRLFHDNGTWRLRLVITRDHLRGSGFPLPIGVATLVECEPGTTIELESRLGRQAIRWTGPQPTSGSIKRFLDELGAAEGQTVFLIFDQQKRFNVVPLSTQRPGTALLSQVVMLTGIEPTDDLTTDTALLATAVGLPTDARPRQILSAFHRRGDDDVAQLLEQAWIRPAQAPPAQI